MGDGVPLSPTVAAATPNTWGHFAKLGAEHAFFVQDPAADFDIMPKGVCMNDDSPVHYHVSTCTCYKFLIPRKTSTFLVVSP